MARTRNEVRLEKDSDGRGERLQYRLLGPVEVMRGDDIVDLGVLKQRALLALLLINANEVVSTDRIIDQLWGDGAGPDREKALRVDVAYGETTTPADLVVRTDYVGFLDVRGGRISLEEFGAEHLEVVEGPEHVGTFATLMSEALAEVS